MSLGVSLERSLGFYSVFTYGIYCQRQAWQYDYHGEVAAARGASQALARILPGADRAGV